jgi:acyl carrier protein
MNQQKIYEKLTEIARDIFDDDELNLTPATNADDVPEWDSMNHINFVATIEASFGIKFKSAEIEELKNIGELVLVIEQNLASQQR